MATHKLLRNKMRFEALERREMLHGDDVLPMVVFETNFGDIPMELLEENAPGTVDNFLTYITDKDYANSIFHRLVPGFVLQGGGFTVSNAELCSESTCTPADVDPLTFNRVPTDPPIVNEFDVSNVRGTVAMAKTAVSPDTATSQFFVNLNDNSANLDNQNGGFTVFARVTDMTVVDEIAGYSTINLSSIFDTSDPDRAPLSAIAAAPVEGNRVVRVENVSGDAVVHGTIFLDLDNDGVRSQVEDGMANRTVYIDVNNDGTRDPSDPFTTTDDEGRFHFRVEPNSQTVVRVEELASFAITNQSESRDVSVDLGRSLRNQDFGLRYTGDSWTNPLNNSDVDGVNGVNPTDAIGIVNELQLRNFSSPDDGSLPNSNNNTDDPRFFDVNENGFVDPGDVGNVVNTLIQQNNNAQAPLSAGAVSASPSEFVAAEETATAIAAKTPVASVSGERQARSQSAATSATRTVGGSPLTAHTVTPMEEATMRSSQALDQDAVDTAFLGW